MMRKTAAVLVAGLSLAGCEKVEKPANPPDLVVESIAEPLPEPVPADFDPATLPGNWYRFAVTATNVDPVPFFAFIPDDGKYAAVKNGDQILTGLLSREKDTVSITFPVPGTELSATLAQDGKVTGTWKSVVLEKTITLPLSGTRVDAATPAARFAPIAGDTPAAMAGSWRLDMGQLGAAKLTLGELSGNGISAAITFPSGNWVYLVGSLSGDTLRLSAFDATAFYYLRATVKGKNLTGEWVAGPDLSNHAAFTGTRDDSFEVERIIGAVATHLRIPELSQVRYEGKPVIVELSGTWCANCVYANEVLADLYERHHEEGLEVITLLYEFTDDEAYNNAQAQKYAKLYSIPWEVIPIHGGVEVASEIVPPGLEGLDTSGFPVAIFVNADGTIHDIHAGFPSPEMPAYESQVALYEKLVKAIVQGGAS